MDFNSEDYLDYLESIDGWDKNRIIFIDSNKKFIYIEYDGIESRLDGIIRNIEKNIRFSETMNFTFYDYDLNILEILIVEINFYNRNETLNYESIKWKTHPLYTELSKNSSDIEILGRSSQSLFNRYKDSKKADNICDEISIIKDFDTKGMIEFYIQDIDDVIKFWDNNVLKTRYLLLKYCGV